MKKKITKIFGVGLAFMLVLSLMVAFAPVAVAADYEENDWGTWGLPDTEPDTNVGPMAVAPDGTLYAAVQMPTELWSEGAGTAEWSTDEYHTGDYSVALTIPDDPDSDDDGAVVWIPIPSGITLEDITTLEFYEYVETPYDAAFPVTLGIYLDTNENGVWDGWDSVVYDSAPTADDVLYLELPSGAFTDDDWELMDVFTDFKGAPASQSALYQPLSYWQLSGNYPAGYDATVLAVDLAIGWNPASYDDVTIYVDDLAIGDSSGYIIFDLELVDGLEAPKVIKSEDNGYTWDDTELDDASDWIVDIAISPNYEEDEIVYVGCLDGTVYRLEDAGEGDVIAIKDIVDSEGTTASQLFSMDVWTDEDDYNWIMVGTDLDVLVLKDKTFEDWRDQELATGGSYWVAYEVAFAPDFDESELIWAVIDDTADGGDDFLITATASPGQWGQDIGEVDLGLDASPYVDIGFPDDYDSDPDTGDTNLWVAVSSPDTGDIFLIEGVDADDGDSNAISMFDDIGGESATDFNSIAVSGDYGDEIILAGELSNPTVWISDDGGYGWDTVDKSPTGEGMTYVIMEADVVWDGDVFDTDEGMAFAATTGAESAVSRANDGGLVYNQVGYIDTVIDDIDDLGFHPDFPDNPVFLLGTVNYGYMATSLWLTENGDEEEPDYMRVLCAHDGTAPGNQEGDFWLVEYAQDGGAIYISGVDDGGDSSIWKSTDDGQTFGKKRSVKDDAFINDWVITEDDTIYAAASDDGFYMTTNSGLSWSSYDVGTTNDICLSPDFENDETILLGGTSGEVYMSDDGGDSFDDTGLGLSSDMYVAFDADYADEDADGYMLIYAADSNGADIQEGEVSDTDDVDWNDLEDDGDNTEYADCGGLVVAEDNALYCIDTDVDDLDRLLLHEDDSEWQWAGDGDLDDPWGLWITSGSNVLWTIDMDDAELWVLEDTLSGQVTLDSPPDGYQSDRLTVIGIAWDEMRGADEYEWSLDETSGLGTDEGDTTDDTSVNVSVTASSEYDWKVRVAPLDTPSDTWHSRWSDEWTFNTALGDAPWAPTLYTPGGEWQYSGLDVELMPAFSWESAKNADSYQFVLADNAEFTSPLVNEKVPESAYNLDFELEYNSNYFWRVMAYDGNKALSRWSDIGAFTTITEPGAPPPSPAPPATVTQPAPAPVVIPTLIPPVLLWVIVGIGAALIIAVIVLIVRTRRAV